jgi:hypothetical protein
MRLGSRWEEWIRAVQSARSCPPRWTHGAITVQFPPPPLDGALDDRWHTDCFIQGMPDYRIYLFKDGRLTAPAKVIACQSDKAAIEHAKKLVDGHDIEVWQGARPVTRLKSQP